MSDLKEPQVNEHGLWDKQDGWIIPISSTVAARNLWHRAIRFASCPSCKGVHRYMDWIRTKLKDDTSIKSTADASITSIPNGWPDNIVEFLSSLPR